MAASPLDLPQLAHRLAGVRAHRTDFAERSILMQLFIPSELLFSIHAYSFLSLLMGLSVDFSLPRELRLCTVALNVDSRNFHCWNYRRWVAAQLGGNVEEERKFTSDLIAKNFSNYSAWHHRRFVTISHSSSPSFHYRVS